MSFPNWFFPATRLKRELRKAGYRVDVDVPIPLLDAEETFYAVFGMPGKDGWRRMIGHYTTDLPFEGLRIRPCSDPNAAAIMRKYGEVPA